MQVACNADNTACVHIYGNFRHQPKGQALEAQMSSDRLDGSHRWTVVGSEGTAGSRVETAQRIARDTLADHRAPELELRAALGDIDAY